MKELIEGWVHDQRSTLKDEGRRLVELWLRGFAMQVGLY